MGKWRGERGVGKGVAKTMDGQNSAEKKNAGDICRILK